MVAANQAQIAILAGGQSRRMGQDKSFVQLNGKSMIQHVIDNLRQLNLDIMIITNTPTKYAQFGLPLFADEIPGSGSLGGLYTALLQATSDYVLCVACDMPFLNTDLLDYFIRLRAGYDAVIPITDGTAHNLHAIYARRCHSIIRKQIDQGNLRISDFYQPLNVCYVFEPELRIFDSELKSLANLNTLDDLQLVKGKAKI